MKPFLMHTFRSIYFHLKQKRAKVPFRRTGNLLETRTNTQTICLMDSMIKNLIVFLKKRCGQIVDEIGCIFEKIIRRGSGSFFPICRKILRTCSNFEQTTRLIFNVTFLHFWIVQGSYVRLPLLLCLTYITYQGTTK